MRTFLLFSALFFGLTSKGQRITNFNLFLVENAVSAKFTLTAGSTCFGYKLMHSLDSMNFTEAASEAAVCGNSSSDENLGIVHTNPVLNARNFYRIQMSTFESSEIRSVFVGKNNAPNMLVIPNPVYSYNQVQARLLGMDSKRVQGFIYNEFGVERKYIDLTTQGDLATIEVASLENGLYLLWLTDGQMAYSAKFIIIR